MAFKVPECGLEAGVVEKGVFRPVDGGGACDCHGASNPSKEVRFLHAPLTIASYFVNKRRDTLQHGPNHVLQVLSRGEHGVCSLMYIIHVAPMPMLLIVIPARDRYIAVVDIEKSG